MSGGKETLKGSMSSGIYISLNFRIVLSIRKEVQISITQLREIYSGKEPLKGWYVRYSDFHISNNSSDQFFGPEGGIDELWKSEGRVCMPRRYLHPSQSFWLLVPIGQTEG